MDRRGRLLGWSLPEFGGSTALVGLQKRGDSARAPLCGTLPEVGDRMLLVCRHMFRREFHSPDLHPRRLRIGVLLFCTAWIWPAAAFITSYASPMAALIILAVYFLMNLSPIEAMTTETYYTPPPPHDRSTTKQSRHVRLQVGYRN